MPGLRNRYAVVSDCFGWAPGMASMSSLSGTPSCLLVFVLIRSGAAPRSGPAVPSVRANTRQLVLVDASALCDPTMPDWKNVGDDIEVGVIVDECEIVLGR